METIMAINAVFEMLGVSADIVEKVHAQANKQAKRASRTSSGSVIPFEQEIAELALSVLIGFIWYHKVDVQVHESFGQGRIAPSDGRKVWEQYQYDTLERRLNEKLNLIGYCASVSPQVGLYAYYIANIKITPKGTHRVRYYD
jgi:hypothetical protein